MTTKYNLPTLATASVAASASVHGQENAAIDKQTKTEPKISKTTQGTQQQSKPCSSSANIPQQRERPSSRLTQAWLELSPDNQVKLVTARRAGRQKVNHCRTSGQGKARRKRRSPLMQAGGGKRAKGVVDLVSPTIKDYFKTSGSSCGSTSKAASNNLKGKRTYLSNVKTVSF